MKLNVYSVYDSKVGAYMTPFFMRSNGEALRAFIEIASDPQTSICKHPEDFTLFHIGSWDSSDASYDSELAPKSLGVALEYSAKNPQLPIINKDTVHT